jgi:hypothetical protein|tara:strand:- start:1397 stop:1678 length:282 start_codon:yes stop_codon:yes gene_type:complete
MKQVKRLISSLNNWIQLQTNPHWSSLTGSSQNYEKEDKLMANEFNHQKYTGEQMAEIYAKLEVSKMLIKMGTDMAKQVEADIKFYRMTNGIED